MTDRELLEFIATQVGKLTDDMDGVKAELVNVKSGLKGTNLTMERNHSEVISSLSRLESNQDAIKQFILNSDDTFKKSEEAYNVIQKFKEVFTK